MNKTLEYLKNSYNKSYHNPVGEISLAGLRVYVKEPIPEGIDIRSCLSYVFDNMPRQLYSNVQGIQIGQFPFLRKRQAEAVYKDGIIYLSNDQQSEMDIISDVIHEISHAFEEQHSRELYEDKTIENEFLSKRETLYQLLNFHNLVTYPVKRESFYNLNYDMTFDNYLHQIVGYDKLGTLTVGLFISPYGATCIREYYGNAFENFFTNDIFIVKKYSPSIYNKLVEFLEM